MQMEFRKTPLNVLRLLVVTGYPVNRSIDRLTGYIFSVRLTVKLFFQNVTSFLVREPRVKILPLEYFKKIPIEKPKKTLEREWSVLESGVKTTFFCFNLDRIFSQRSFRQRRDH